MPTFVDQPGVPMVSVISTCDSGQSKVTLRQHRYYVDKALWASPTSELWKIPVLLKGASGATQWELLTLTQHTFEVPQCSSWIFANGNAEGYYRAKYDSAIFAQLASDAEKNLSPAERIVLVRDAWAAVRAGQQPIGDFLKLANALASDRNSIVVSQVDRQLDYIGEYLVAESDRAQYQAWVRKLLRPVFNEVGWQASPGDDENRKELRAYVLYTLGYTGGDAEVLGKARELAQKALDTPAAVDASIIETIFRLAAVNGDPGFYDQIMEHLKSTNGAPQQYYRYLASLAWFSNPALLRRTLEYAMSPDVRTQDKLILISRVLRNPKGEKLAWSFVQSQWPQISKVMGGYNTGELIESTGSFCDTGLRNDVRAFFTQHTVPDAERSFRQAQETAGNCIDLRANQAPALASWLGTHGSASGASR
ncbi:MAG: ERAP1-like C-terminal domain-containing protein [Acidobacteria bacterium]|nr:ERAP1-like C-terminal domain-containing protein [Acidobacteriota bacterium]